MLLKLKSLNTLLSLFSVSSGFLIKRENSTQAQNAEELESIWDYSMDGGSKVHGVSLGGWFVLEPYITPSLFEQFGSNDSAIPVDEYTFTEALGHTEAKEQLEKHWSTYYNESDFEDIKNYGFNTVRIPIGYWAFFTLDDDPYVQGQEKYLDNAISWAASNDLKVWIDLHGVPGSQNGFDNSGKRGSVEWQDSEENILLTYETLNYIFGKYGGSNYTDTITAIEIVNEPLVGKLNETDLIDFYYNSYYDYRKVQNVTENYFAIHDAFESIGFWNTHFNNDYTNVSSQYVEPVDADLASEEDYFQGILVDHHHYEVFTDNQLSQSSNDRIKAITDYAKGIKPEQQYHPSLIGEFSGAITDCARWLNGVGTGARYDGTFDESQLISNSPYNSSSNVTAFVKSTETKSCANVTNYDNFTEEHKADIQKFIEIQLLEYDLNTAGWIFWNYKTEDAIEWDFKKLNEKGLFPPAPFNTFKYFYSNGTLINDTNSTSGKKSGSVSQMSNLDMRYLMMTMFLSVLIGTASFL